MDVLVARGLLLTIACLLLNGCAALAPYSSLVSMPEGGSPPREVHEQTRVGLDRDNFVLVKTNVWGRSKGFSLLGVITIVPPTLTKAMTRMYASAQMRPGEPQTVAHLVIEQTSSFWILFGIPKIEVRSDIVEFNPEVKARAQVNPKQAPAGPPDERPP
jgi:hypothetical protein